MSRPRSPWLTASILLGCAAVLVGAFALLGRLLGSSTTMLEQGWIRTLEHGRAHQVTDVAKAVSFAASREVLAPVAAVIAIVLLLRRLWRPAVFLIATSIGGFELSDVAKLLVQRPRPPKALRLASAGGTSFPSGHATQAVAVLVGFALVAAAIGAARTLALTLGVLGAAVVGVSRVLLGVHYPTDVVAGWCLGGAWVALCRWTLLADRAPG